MIKKIRVDNLPDFDPAEQLKDEEDVAAYLTIVMEENDPALLAAALGDIARSRGMSEISKASGITREALYKALRPKSNPRFDTIQKKYARRSESSLKQNQYVQHKLDGGRLSFPLR